VADLMLVREAAASVALDGETQSLPALTMEDFPAIPHLHRPDTTSPRAEERFRSGAREVRYPCSVCGEFLSWRHA
jgi:hypothetical protein